MNQKCFPTEYWAINDIFKDWNPIGVDEPSLSDEYIGYIPAIMKIYHDVNQLIDYLEHVLINEIGVNYDSSNKQHKKDVICVARKINNISS
jgi:hypothetical protein